jgi:hypothetical protein
LDGISQQVSLREPDFDSPSDPALGSQVLASLINITSSHFNIKPPSALQHNSPGGIFALAEVWPSRKVLILPLHEHFF